MTIFNKQLLASASMSSAEIAKLNAEAAAERAARATVQTAKEQLNKAKDSRAAAASELSKLTGKPTLAPIHRATTSAPVAVAKPTPAMPGLISAAQFAKPQMTMLRSEWQNLSAADQSRFFRENGKLVDGPKPSKK